MGIFGVAGVRTVSRSLKPVSSVTESMIEAFASIAGWQQLEKLWELIVLVCKFFWELLRLLSGGG